MIGRVDRMKERDWTRTPPVRLSREGGDEREQGRRRDEISSSSRQGLVCMLPRVYWLRRESLVQSRSRIRSTSSLSSNHVRVFAPTFERRCLTVVHTHDLCGQSVGCERRYGRVNAAFFNYERCGPRLSCRRWRPCRESWAWRWVWRCPICLLFVVVQVVCT